MNKILDDVRRDACKKLRESEAEDLTSLIDTAVTLLQLHPIAHFEGLLAVEEAAQNLKSEYARLLISLMVDGTDPDIILEIGTNEYWMKNPQDLDAMIYYLYLQGILHIQSGDAGYIMDLLLQTLLPEKCHSQFLEKVEAILNKRDWEIDENMLYSSSIFESTELVEKLQELEQEIKLCNNRAMKRIIREVDTFTLGVCLLGLNEEAKERFLKNVSARYAYFLIEYIDYYYCNKVREKDALECVERMINTIHKLRNCGDII